MMLHVDRRINASARVMSEAKKDVCVCGVGVGCVFLGSVFLSATHTYSEDYVSAMSTKSFLRSILAYALISIV